MKHEPIGYRPERAEESDVIFDMLEDIEAEEQIVMFINVFGSPDSEFDSIRTLDHPYCLCRRIIAHESCSVQCAGDYLQHAAGSAADVHDRFRPETPITKH